MFDGNFLVAILVPIALCVVLPVMIVWIVAIVLMDFLAKGGLLNGFNAKNFLEWLYTFAAHLIILGAMITLND